MASIVDEGSLTEETERPKCNYSGPQPNVKYPLSVLYCGGKFRRTDGKTQLLKRIVHCSLFFKS
jgi:hypothetical protein